MENKNNKDKDMKKKNGILLAAVLSGLGICLLKGLFSPVYVDHRPVRNTYSIEDTENQYTVQYPENTALFSDKDTESEYIHKECTIYTSIPVFFLKLTGKNVQSDIKYYGKNGQSVENAIKTIADAYNAGHTAKAENAVIKYNRKKRKYTVVPASAGSYIDAEKIISAYHSGKRNIGITPVLSEPEITTEEAEKAAAEANRILKWHVSYSDGFTIQLPSQYVSIKNAFVRIKSYNFRQELLKLDELYGTQGQKRTVRLHNGKTYTSGKGTWGDLTNSTEERKYLQNLLNRRVSAEGRTPVMKKRIPDLVIDVDTSHQHVWAYRPDGSPVMDSSCVTGQKGKHDTPKGIYYISQISENYDMHGDGYVSHCKRFMRITNTGVALHDASWRSRFGGNIYTYSGSHGCINLPSDFALKLAKRVTPGKTMVIVH